MREFEKLKITTILGTRPEIIRLSCVIESLDALSDIVEHRIVHTGQNYDYELNQVFFDELNVRCPDEFLGINTSSLGSAIAGIIEKTEQSLIAHRPHAILILGDTNSALAAIIAKRMGVIVYHMEAGNRCFDNNVPEEMNRRIVDHISDFNLAYTEHGRRHLLSEGFPQRRIFVTGSPMHEVLNRYENEINNSEVLSQLNLQTGKYLVVSMHRQENVDNEHHLTQLLDACDLLAREFSLPIIVSTHPRTRKRIDAAGLVPKEDVRLMSPFGFFDYVHLQKNSFCTVSDSGTISEESSILGFPAVTIRNAIERPEALDAGGIVMAGLKPEDIYRCVRLVTLPAQAPMSSLPSGYEHSDCSRRVVRQIFSTISVAKRWLGVDNDVAELG